MNWSAKITRELFPLKEILFSDKFELFLLFFFKGENKIKRNREESQLGNYDIW